MPNGKKKLYIIGVTVLSAGVIYYFINKKIKENKVNNQITSVDDALQILAEKSNPVISVDDTKPFDMTDAERYGIEEYGGNY